MRQKRISQCFWPIVHPRGSVTDLSRGGVCHRTTTGAGELCTRSRMFGVRACCGRFTDSTLVGGTQQHGSAPKKEVLIYDLCALPLWLWAVGTTDRYHIGVSCSSSDRRMGEIGTVVDGIPCRAASHFTRANIGICMLANAGRGL